MRLVNIMTVFNRYNETKEEKLTLEAAQERNRAQMNELRQNIENLNLKIT